MVYRRKIARVRSIDCDNLREGIFMYIIQLSSSGSESANLI